LFDIVNTIQNNQFIIQKRFYALDNLLYYVHVYTYSVLLFV